MFAAGDRAARGTRVLLLLCGVTVLLNLMGLFSGRDPLQVLWEDSFMFARYAHNFVRYHELVWNARGPAVYGLTSLAYFFMVIAPLQVLFAPVPAVLIVTGSLLCGILFLVALGWLAVRHSLAEKCGSLLLVAFSLAMSARDLSAHFLSGMDTMFAVLFLTLFLGVLKWQERRSDFGSAVLLGLVAGLAFAVRPDLLVLTCGVPATYVVFARVRRERWQGAVTLLAALGVFSVQVALASRLLHSPLPLPFYAKALRLYPGFATYRTAGFEYLLQFCVSFRFLLLTLGAAILWRRTETLRTLTRSERGMALAAIVFAAYYAVGVTQVMGMHQRFYYPLLPILAFLAVRVLPVVIAALRTSFAALPRAGELAFLLIVASLIPVLMQPLHEAVRVAAGGHFPFDIGDEYRHGWRMYWYQLDGLSRLPDDLVMATTETGHVAAMNLEKLVVDMSGLNDTAFAHQPFSAARFFWMYRPDLIYMPPEDYRGMNTELFRSPVFREKYEHFSTENLGGAAMGIAIRRDSKYYGAMRKLVRPG